MQSTGDALHAEAVRLSNDGRYADAQEVLRRVDLSAAEPNLRSRVLGTLGYVAARLGEPERADMLCREALVVEGIDPATYALAAGQLGSIAEQRGRFDDADAWLSRAIDVLDVSSPEVANLLVNRCLVRIHRRALRGAREDIRAAAGIFRAAGLGVDAAQALHNEGYISLLEGDLVAALRDMALARPVAGAVSPVAAAVGDADRAEALREAGSVREAEELLRSAAELFAAQGMPQARAETELQLARSLLVHDADVARRVAADAADRFRTLDNAAWAARADGVRVLADLRGGAVTTSGRRVAAPDRVPDAAEVDAVAADLERHGFRSDAASVRLSFALWQARQQMLGEAGPVRMQPEREAADRVPPVRVPRAASLDVRLLAHEVRAVRAAARGQLGRARRHAAEGLAELETWRAGFGSIDLHTSTAMHGTGLLSAGLDAAVRSGRPDVVFEWSERARHAAAQVVPLRPPPDPALASDLAELRMLRSEGPEWQADPRVRALQERVRERQWVDVAAASARARASVADVQAVLDRETAMLSYVFTGDRMSVLVLTAEGVRLRPVPGWDEVRGMLPGLRSDLDMSASIRGRMGEVVRRSLDVRLARLSALLADDAVAAAGTRRFVLTAPGVLSGIPWTMLPAFRDRVTTLAASASRWVADREVPAREGAPGVAGRAGFAVGPRTRRGAEEVAIGAAAWVDACVRDAASVADAIALAGEVDTLHIAAHGRHAADNPLFSGLELGDGTLFGYDVDLMPRVPSLVVLSACEGGRSAVRWGEEAIGMSRVWLHAGARSVIAAPVIVADDDACELLGAVHVALAEGRAPAEALAAASARTGIIAPFQVHGSGF
ncbi:CHAT domain-containing protein [Microbacterium chocolatum]|uniref:CHAT domain-containing protein n=1 Tax=Microbacterium aurantiacum TaxID=162393 RepID=UPI00339016F1